MTAELFVCPSSQGERATGATPQEMASRLVAPEHLSYAYVAAGMDASTSGELVLLHDRPENHSLAVITVLYADGQVDFLGRDKTKWLLDELAAGHNPPQRKRGP